MELKAIKRMDKKGVLGLETAKAFIILILTLAVIAFAVVIALSELNDTSVLTSGSQADNDTDNIINNVTGGITDFFSNAGSWFSLLAIVVIILIIAIVIVTVNRFGGSAQGGL